MIGGIVSIPGYGCETYRPFLNDFGDESFDESSIRMAEKAIE
jgi:hypothetical protein